MTDGRHYSYPTATELHVDAGVGKGRDGIPGEGGEEDERDYGIREVIVFFQLSGVRGECHGSIR